jgi:UDP-N-acetylmuramoyl-tripeptide--D-alanyl-D-alanine ligase
VLGSREVSAPCIVAPTADHIDPVVVALGRLARLQREYRSQLTVVGITGSSGKTTTKDIIGQVLAYHEPTYAPVGSPNNELGLPLTLLKAPDAAQVIVAEMGMRGVGHIAYLCGIAQPTIGVVTNVGQAHIGELGSIDAIARAKTELVTALPATGFAILNNDDERVRAMRFETVAHVITYGLREGSDVRGESVSVNVDGSSTFDIVHGNDRHTIHLPLLGLHNVSNALAAAATGIAAGMTLRVIAEALERVTSKSKWRMETTLLSNGATVINDAYNANPESMAAALVTLSGFPGSRWAVLGGMRELGETEADQHERIGAICADLGIDHVVCVGELGEQFMPGAKAGKHAVWFPDYELATNYIVAKLTGNDTVLVKASRSEGLERLAHLLIDQVGVAT